MAINLSDLKTVRADKPPRIMIYGSEGVGKTTLASEFPDAVFLQIEEGTPGEGVELQSFGLLEDFNAVMDALEALVNQDHDKRTLVVDSVTALQRLVFAETCRRGDENGHSKANIEDFGYGKGYVKAKAVLRELIEGLNAARTYKGMAIVLIAHSTVSKFDDPESQAYDRYEIDLHKQLVGEITRDLDAILLLKKPTQVKEDKEGFNRTRARASDTNGQTVLIHGTGKPAFVAKNRYGIPDGMRFDRGKGFEALSRFLPTFAPAEPAGDKKKAA